MQSRRRFIRNRAGGAEIRKAAKSVQLFLTLGGAAFVTLGQLQKWYARPVRSRQEEKQSLRRPPALLRRTRAPLTFDNSERILGKDTLCW